MARKFFHVPFVKRDLLDEWRSWWNESGEPSDAARAAHAANQLGRTVLIEAESKAAAAREVEQRNPGCVVIRESIQSFRQ